MAKARVFIAILALAISSSVFAVDAPKPVGPLPTGRQLEWHSRPFAAYFRFNLQTFGGDAKSFDPPKLEPAQWIQFAKEAGFQRVVMTARDADGFCFWPTKTRALSIKDTAWQSGKGDLLKQFIDAAHAAKLEVGVYLSARDNPDYFEQLAEVLSNYGEIDEVRLDGAGGEGTGAQPTYDKSAALPQMPDFEKTVATIRKLQPRAIIVSNIGPDARWNGNNIGHAGEPNWATFDPASVPGQLLSDKKQLSILNNGDLNGKLWCPAECFVMTSADWCWKEPENLLPADKLFNAYCKSTGKNCVLLLNIPVSPSGAVSDAQMERILELHTASEAMFSHDLASGAKAIASNFRGASDSYSAQNVLDGNAETYWATDDSVSGDCFLEIDLGKATAFSAIAMSEPMQLGQRVETYHVDILDGDQWKTIVPKGRSIGRNKIERFTSVTAQKIRLTVEKSRGCPLISSFSVYMK
jgi:alpha-L-fucosidase